MRRKRKVRRVVKRLPLSFDEGPPTHTQPERQTCPLQVKVQQLASRGKGIRPVNEGGGPGRRITPCREQDRKPFPSLRASGRGTQIVMIGWAMAVSIKEFIVISRSS